jgi:hypothetical protein
MMQPIIGENRICTSLILKRIYLKKRLRIYSQYDVDLVTKSHIIIKHRIMSVIWWPFAAISNPPVKFLATLKWTLPATILFCSTVHHKVWKQMFANKRMLLLFINMCAHDTCILPYDNFIFTCKMYTDKCES